MFRTKIYDKRDWLPGPWQQENDCIRWLDETTGLTCVMHRVPQTGAWRAFVGVPPEHPLYLTNKTHTVFEFVDVHNGITFAGIAPSEDEFFSPPIRRWWVGFHLAGNTDFKPKEIDNAPFGEYRDEEFAMKETESLAEQLYRMYDGEQQLDILNDESV